MSNFAILRHGRTKFKSLEEIAVAEEHNLREIPTPGADGSGAVRRIYGGGRAVDRLQQIIDHYDIKVRKNAALAMEYVLTFSPEMESEINLNDWIQANIKFLQAEHGDGLLTVDVHLDEKTPHLHAICAPLIKKEVRGKEQMRLSGVDFWKGKQKLSARQDRYAKAMRPFGLARGIKGSRATHRTLKEFNRLLEADIASLDKLKLIKSPTELFRHLKEVIGIARALRIRNKDLKSDVESLRALVMDIQDKDMEKQVRELTAQLRERDEVIETFDKGKRNDREEIKMLNKLLDRERSLNNHLNY
jgi:hypothetical protein